MLGLAWKTLGWFLAGVAVALGFLLVPLQVAAERKKLDRTVADIAQARRDIRALETEFETRANLAQLDQWNNDTLRLVAPGAGQFVADEAALAAIDVRQPGTAGIQTASFVPSPPVSESLAAAAPAQAETVAPKPVAAPAAAPAKPAPVVAVAAVKQPAVKRAKAQAVAMLDRKLLSDSTVGDLLSSARAESRSAR
ncbi:hypothetical protein PX554_13335 [Sphingomonas sp. H39-1-10]|uniref:hypothetical protein n=1 Tax=Sphingomonas TaxID=13687 RepID=UPI00088CCADD|nr:MULTISPECIES: hypothetical protein [Sphingomonas]MDF0489120.1 hypothetical protein [Sphingomonas pollutisoli]SDA20921.1 hypothetical protein SAMN03159340_01352 [Sphingomonas sp. NFR15]